MKTSYTLSLLALLFISQLKAQDTIFFENFNDWNYQEIDSIFENYDEDHIEDYNGLSGGWFVGNFGNGGIDSTEVVALSSSWLTGYQPGNRNHLRLPGYHLWDTSATLSWRSAPALGNLYRDGYSVLVSTDPDFFYYVESSGCDTLMHFAQNINDDESQNSLGLMHSSFDTLAPINLTGITQYPGKLMDWEVSLADYAGQTIYISFLHNSDDDNLIAIDDILLFGNGSPLAIEDDKKNYTPSLYPNPASGILNIDLTGDMEVESINIYNAVGQLVQVESSVSTDLIKIDISQMVKGLYYISLITKQGVYSNQFIKQ